MCINSSYLLSISPIIEPFLKNRSFCVIFQQYSSKNIELKVISWQNGWIIGEMDKNFVEFMQIYMRTSIRFWISRWTWKSDFCFAPQPLLVWVPWVPWHPHFLKTCQLAPTLFRKNLMNHSEISNIDNELGTKTQRLWNLAPTLSNSQRGPCTHKC